MMMLMMLLLSVMMTMMMMMIMMRDDALMNFRHLTEAKTQLAMLKDMLHQNRAVQQQASVSSRLGSSVGGPSLSLTAQATGGTLQLNTSQRYGCVECGFMRIITINLIIVCSCKLLYPLLVY